jgi:hypothetical protein
MADGLPAAAPSIRMLHCRRHDRVNIHRHNGPLTTPDCDKLCLLAAALLALDSKSPPDHHSHNHSHHHHNNHQAYEEAPSSAAPPLAPPPHPMVYVTLYGTAGSPSESVTNRSLAWCAGRHTAHCRPCGCDHHSASSAGCLWACKQCTCGT